MEQKADRFTSVYHRPELSDRAVVLVQDLESALQGETVRLTIRGCRIWLSAHNDVVWESVLATAGYGEPASWWEPRIFEGDQLPNAFAIFLLGLLFLADVELHCPARDITLTTSHDEWLELSAGEEAAFEQFESRFAAAELPRWKR